MSLLARRCRQNALVVFRGQHFREGLDRGEMQVPASDPSQNRRELPRQAGRCDALESHRLRETEAVPTIREHRTAIFVSKQSARIHLGQVPKQLSEVSIRSRHQVLNSLKELVIGKGFGIKTSTHAPTKHPVFRPPTRREDIVSRVETTKFDSGVPKPCSQPVSANARCFRKELRQATPHSTKTRQAQPTSRSEKTVLSGA